MIRFKPRIGQMAVAANSRIKRPKPRLRSFNITLLTLCVISPIQIPPKVVAIRSLMAGGSISPQNSHISEPPRAYGADSQKLSPLLRAAL